MWHLHRPLRWILGVVISLTLLGPGGNWVSEIVFGRSVPGWREIVAANWHWLVLLYTALIGLVYAARRDDERRQDAEQRQLRKHEEQNRTVQHLLAKPVPILSPEDFGFQVLAPGQVSTTLQPRPYYSTYIHRSAVPHYTNAQSMIASLSTMDLAAALHRGESFVIVGPPTDGKTRTLYEVIKLMEGYDVVVPRTPEIPPDVILHLEGRDVVLVLDELENYASSRLSLLELRRELERVTNRCVVAATCRDGPQLESVRESAAPGLRRFFEDILLKLSLAPATEQQKRELARGIRKPDWEPRSVDKYPTLGCVTMGQALSIMAERFWGLRPLEQDTLRALQLLTAAGLPRISHAQIEGVLIRVFRREHMLLGDILDTLANASFLRRPARQDPVRPEPSYLAQAVPYVEGRSPEDDFSTLRGLLSDLKDSEALYYVGLVYDKQAPYEALICYEIALQMRPDFPEAWHAKGHTLLKLVRTEEALASFDEAVRLEPENSENWHAKYESCQGCKLGRVALAGMSPVKGVNWDVWPSLS